MDVICLQETRLSPDAVTPELTLAGYRSYFSHASKPGYSGVALLSKLAPDEIIEGFGSREFDAEGRYLEARFGALSIASVYLPSGSSGEVRQQAKYRCLAQFLTHLRGLVKQQRQVILCGDINIAHQNIDIKNWRGNLKNSGFLPEERAWLDQLFGAEGFSDGFRAINQSPEQYTWWSNRGQAYAKNVGWRIDYHIVSKTLVPTIQAAEIYKATKFSDHAPLILDYALSLSQLKAKR